MGIGLLPEHTDLADAVAAFSDRHAPIASTRAEFDDLAAGVWPAAWQQFVDQGLLSLHLPEIHGGDGAGMVELAVVLEEAGRGLVPGPLLPTVLTSALIARFGDPSLQENLLPRFVAGATGCCATSVAGLTATPGPVGWVVCGLTAPVLGALGAEVVLLGAQAPEGVVWFVLHGAQVDGIVRKQAEGVDVTRDIGRLELIDVVVPAGQVLAVDTAQVLAVAGVLFAAEATGLARWCQETGLSYAKVREQFGRPIGSFQAIKHKCARLLVELEVMTAAVWDAAQAASESEDQFALAAAAATEVCVHGAVDLALETVTLLGGIGYTWEHDVHLYMRRAMSLAALLGPRSERQSMLGELALRTSRTTHLTLSGEPEGLRDRIVPQIAHAAAQPEPARRRALADAGLVAPHYPAPYGLGLDAVGQVVVAQEFEKVGLQQPTTVIGEWVLPTILAHGTDQQRQQFVDPTLRGEIVWCQLFSEPGAGSDLASLTTRAERIDGGWRINGQKVWTSGAHQADVAICLARTDSSAPKHKGLSYFIVNMRAAGVEVRPLREANGGYFFNEVFLTDVDVPDEALMGAPGDGWKLARTTLGNERVSIGSGRSAPGHADVAALARARVTAGHDSVRRDVGVLTARANALDALARRDLLRRLSGLKPGAEASMLKVASAWHSAQRTRTVLGWHDAEAAVMEGEAGSAAFDYLTVPALLIGGGTVDIQLNVIAERMLGLPRD